MNFARHFTSQKPWMKGGMISAAICALLFGFYLFIYFPAVYLMVQTDPNAEEPAWELALPTVTGHIFPLMTHFAIEGTSITKSFCKETETHCLAWSLEYQDGGVPWTDAQGGNGYCLLEESSPLASCADRVEGAASLLTLAALEAIYFMIGAGVATILDRKKAQTYHMKKL